MDENKQSFNNCKMCSRLKMEIKVNVVFIEKCHFRTLWWSVHIEPLEEVSGGRSSSIFMANRDKIRHRWIGLTDLRQLCLHDTAGAWEEVSGCGGVVNFWRRPSAVPVYGPHTGSKQTQLELVVYFVVELNSNSFLAKIVICFDRLRSCSQKKQSNPL